MTRASISDGELLAAALARDVWTDPALVGIAAARFEEKAQLLLAEVQDDIARRILANGEDPPGEAISERLVRVALHELTVGTALVAQSRASGNLDADADAARDAGASLLAFADACGASALPRVYLLHATWLNYRALRYYGEMRRSDFASGRLHRPWCDFDLTEELERGIARGEIESRGEKDAAVRLTAQGHHEAGRLEEEFRRAGILRARDLLRQGSLRDLATGARNVLWRTMPQLRRSSQDFSGYLRQAGQISRIVEVSSVSGMLSQWARDGLLGDAEAICCGGSRGRLLQIEHESSGRVKTAHCGVDGRIPFEDGSVDFVLLPATPLRIWMRGLLADAERILRPGGHVLVTSTRGWYEVFPRDVREALPPVAQDFLRRGDEVRVKDALEGGAFAVESASAREIEGVAVAAQELADLLGETGVLAELYANLPFTAAERSEDDVLDACSAAMRAAHGKLPFMLTSETVFGRRL